VDWSSKGTRHLIKHFQKEFAGNRLKDLRTDNIDSTTIPIKTVFANSSMDLLGLTNIVKHAHSGRGIKNVCFRTTTPGGSLIWRQGGYSFNFVPADGDGDGGGDGNGEGNGG
jgi:hypothetical protein